ncbi:endo alpha-1,4 polygalactosaminidase [Streptomyces xiaopingdaonensis]|uniref:endo alpha-1,4 polygalactosaminidase n=1 Tax=Streptomyces xiaopingdaonensis TaxID=1565415 RepID=UPI0002E55A65|nr:endo alpha-1,4 polygalactosaminidase [Streptomyces xiaopingdaonensis]
MGERTCPTRARAVSAAVALGVLAGCGPPAAGTDPAPPTDTKRSAPQAPPAGVRFDYQLGGASPLPDGAGLVVRDSTASPAPGVYNVCYVNGFQTQPAARGTWLAHHRDLVLDDAEGHPLADEEWPDELLLDTSTASGRARLTDVLGESVARCAKKGFEAVEIDNLDSFTRSRGALTPEDNFALAAALARTAHAAGLAIGQKNAAEFTARGKQAGFDFAVAEECAQYDECASYTRVYGARVLDVEYTDNLDTDFSRVCRAPDTPRSTILRDRALAPAGQHDHVYRRC